MAFAAEVRMDMRFRLYFNAAFPQAHPERGVGSPTDRALAHVKSVLRNDRSSFQELFGPVTGRYGDVGNAITDALYRAADARKESPAIKTGHIICIDGSDHKEWVDWVMGMNPLATKLVLAVSSSSGFTALSARSMAFEQRHIKVVRLESLLNDDGVRDTLRYLTNEAG